MKGVLLFCVVCLLACAGNKYSGVPEKYHALLNQALEKAGENRAELEKALAEAPAEQKEGMAFLIAYMPDRDLKELNAEFLLENTAYAYQARNQYPWAKALPDRVEWLPKMIFSVSEACMEPMVPGSAPMTPSGCRKSLTFS